MTLQIVVPGKFTEPGLPDLHLLGFSDSFNRPDSSSLGNTEKPLRPWEVWAGGDGGTGGVRANEAYVAHLNGSGHSVAAAEAGTGDGVLEMTVGIREANAQIGAAFRGTSITNFWRFYSVGDGFYRLSKYVNGTNTAVNEASSITPLEGDQVRIVLNGPDISCFVNGELAIETSDSDLQSASFHGFYNNGSDESTVREISFAA